MNSSSPGAYRDALPIAQTATWLVVITLVGFAIPAVLSAGLQWPRSLYLAPYSVVMGGLVLAYLYAVGFRFSELAKNWIVGLLVAAAASIYIVFNLASYPRSAPPEGLDLLVSFIWIGVVYGAVDALVLNVFPVIATRGLALAQVRQTWVKLAIRGIAALIVSLIITLIYHVGYAEFRGPAVLAPLLGNLVITATYVVTGSPLAPIVAHVAMHVASVWLGMETLPTLPPHY